MTTDNKVENLQIIRNSVVSSNVKSIGYSYDRKILEIEFMNDQVYQYFEVPIEVCNALAASDSKGAFIAKNIKGKFEFRALVPKEQLRVE